jgi:hypothetical protein
MLLALVAVAQAVPVPQGQLLGGVTNTLGGITQGAGLGNLLTGGINGKGLQDMARPAAALFWSVELLSISTLRKHIQHRDSGDIHCLASVSLPSCTGSPYQLVWFTSNLGAMYMSKALVHVPLPLHLRVH